MNKQKVIVLSPKWLLSVIWDVTIPPTVIYLRFFLYIFFFTFTSKRCRLKQRGMFSFAWSVANSDPSFVFIHTWIVLIQRRNLLIIALEGEKVNVSTLVCIIVNSLLFSWNSIQVKCSYGIWFMSSNFFFILVTVWMCVLKAFNWRDLMFMSPGLML